MTRRSKSEIYLHFVWATYRRAPLVKEEWEEAIYSCIITQAGNLGCTVLAIGGMPDHVHLAVQMPPKLAPARLMQQVKGFSSTLVRQTLGHGEFFGWQDNYAVFSLSRPHKEKVIDYIHRQKAHHGAGTIWQQWEETDEPGE